VCPAVPRCAGQPLPRVGRAASRPTAALDDCRYIPTPGEPSPVMTIVTVRQSRGPTPSCRGYELEEICIGGRLARLVLLARSWFGTQARRATWFLATIRFGSARRAGTNLVLPHDRAIGRWSKHRRLMISISSRSSAWELDDGRAGRSRRELCRGRVCLTMVETARLTSAFMWDASPSRRA